MADTKIEVKISGDIEKLSKEEAGFVDFCKPLRDYEARAPYLFCKAAYKYFNKNRPDILEIEGEVYKPFFYKEILHPRSTAALTVTFLKSDVARYFYRVSGGCVAYEDELFGPFIIKGRKFIAIADTSMASREKDERRRSYEIGKGL